MRAAIASTQGALLDDDARLLDALAAEGLLGEDLRRIVEREHATGTTSLEDVLLEMGVSDPATLARLAGGARTVDLDDEAFVPDARAVACLDAAVARRFRVVPLAFERAAGQADDEDRATLVLASAGVADLPRRDAIVRALPPTLTVRWCVATGSGVARALARCHGAPLGLADIVADCDAGAGGDAIARLVDAVLSEAVTRGASDIHLSPEERFIRVRLRVDGVLVGLRVLQRRHLDALTVRIKVLAGADIAETRRPQDGRFTRHVHGRPVDFRFSSFPLRTGENLVLRVLERRRSPPTIDDLVPEPGARAALRALMHRPDGLIVVCGPTGAGKSTTLYALLGERDTEALNVMTLEDPVEHPAVGVRQAGIDAARGLDYAAGVRALLRQDPDVLLIGEVRDAASCAMALRAAMTGHLVLTTVHAGDAVSAIGRLRELGAEPGLLADVLTGVVAQRLLRLRCTHCDGRGDRDGVPCARCAGSTFGGRRAVLETLTLTPGLRRRLRAADDGESLTEVAIAEGHVPLRDRARRWVRDGVTTEAELDRVFGPPTPVPRDAVSGA